MFCQRNPVAVRLLLTWVARLKDKELFRLGVRIEHVWLAALASVPSQNQGAAVSGSAAFVEAPHHFLRVTAECCVAHNPPSCVGVADTEQSSFASPKKTPKLQKKSRLRFPICEAAQIDGGSRENPRRETSQRRAENGAVGRLFSSPV